MTRRSLDTMKTLRRRLARDEGGWVLATALILMTIMLGTVMATIAWTDSQQRESGKTRTREAAFNIAESALTGQIFAMAQAWPGQAGATDPAYNYGPCTQAASSTKCPNGAALQSLISSPDTANGVQWRTEVRDNGTAANPAAKDFYSDSLTATMPGYDANGDSKVWVRAEAVARGRKRVLVALVRSESLQETLPHAAVVGGWLDISNMGNKVILDGSGAATGSKIVQVRCTPQQNESRPCLGHQIGSGGIKTQDDLTAKLNQQVSPNVTEYNYQGGAAMDPAARDRLKATAMADGTYFATCPGSLPQGGASRVVWIENGDCTYTSNGQVFTPTQPGIVILNRGTIYLGGTMDFYGIIYAVNSQNSDGAVVQIQGNAEVTGGVLIDGPGGLIAGSSKLNVNMADEAFGDVRSYVSAGLIQNTWREIKP
jgi:Tfp pilus assembly protein PilX